jgi:uncharacterized protein with von Willebrand factor type A (vWA) domain
MPMDFSSAGGRVRKLLAPKRPLDLSKSALTEDQLRDNIVAEEAAHSERFKKHVRKQPEVTYQPKDEDGNPKLDDQGQPIEESHVWSTFPEAVRDHARAAFGWDEPEVRPPNEVRPSYQLNREIMASTLADENFSTARPYTRNQPVQSMYGAMAYSAKMQEMASEHLAEHIARSEEMAEQEQAAQSADEMLEKLRQQAKSQIDRTGKVNDKTRRSIKQQTKKRTAAQAALNALMQAQAQSNFFADVATSTAAAAEAAAHAADAITSLPGVDPGTAQNLSPDQQIALAEKWAANKDLQEIARMVGRMIRDMKFKRDARTKNVKIEPVGIETGNDIGLLLPTEMARAYMPTFRPLFIKDYAERSLLQYQMEGKAPAGKGPIIELHDGSGSMSGEPFIWASSLGLTLLTIAQREKRHFAGIEFGSASELKTWHFPKGKPADPDQVIDYAGHFFGGGTSIVTGMKEALRIMREQPEFKTADVILISDGGDYFREDDLAIRNELNALGVRIHGISILAPGNTYLEQMCEYVVDVIDLAGSNDGTDKLAENIT